jgi:hypothetical protein
MKVTYFGTKCGIRLSDAITRSITQLDALSLKYINIVPAECTVMVGDAFKSDMFIRDHNVAFNALKSFEFDSIGAIGYEHIHSVLDEFQEDWPTPIRNEIESIPQANSLKQWWSMNGNNGSSTTRSLSTTMGGNRGPDPFEQRKFISAIKSEQMGYNDKPDWLSFKATVTFLKKEKQGDEGAWYTACANADDPCKNMYKATQTSDGNWHCDKCMKTYENCVRRFIFSGTVADDTCTSWVSVFNEQAEIILNGATANDLYAQVMNGDGKDLYDSTFMKSTYTEWIFKCKVKQELVGDEQRVKTSLVALSPVDYVVESRNLLKALGVQ